MINRFFENISSGLDSLTHNGYAISISLVLMFRKLIKKFLFWCSRTLSKGMIDEGIKKLTPVFTEIVSNILDSKLEENEKKIEKKLAANEKKLEKRLASLGETIYSYKSVKHKIEGELLEAKDAILNNDIDKLNLLRDIYLDNEKKEKNDNE